jgi:hypothetical protein
LFLRPYTFFGLFRRITFSSHLSDILHIYHSHLFGLHIYCIPLAFIASCLSHLSVHNTHKYVHSQLRQNIILYSQIPFRTHKILVLPNNSTSAYYILGLKDSIVSNLTFITLLLAMVRLPTHYCETKLLEQIYRQWFSKYISYLIICTYGMDADQTTRHSVPKMMIL